LGLLAMAICFYIVVVSRAQFVSIPISSLLQKFRCRFRTLGLVGRIAIVECTVMRGRNCYSVVEKVDLGRKLAELGRRCEVWLRMITIRSRERGIRSVRIGESHA
jgi:hypothetical protein